MVQDLNNFYVMSIYLFDGTKLNIKIWTYICKILTKRINTYAFKYYFALIIISVLNTTLLNCNLGSNIWKQQALYLFWHHETETKYKLPQQFFVEMKTKLSLHQYDSLLPNTSKTRSPLAILLTIKLSTLLSIGCRYGP